MRYKQSTGGVRPNASENSQINPSTIVRFAQGDGSRPNLASVLQEWQKRVKTITHRTTLSPTSDEPATTSSINRLSFVHGQPLCVDRDALAAMLVAGVLTSNTAEAATLGCQTIPEDAKLELLERYPSAFPFMRMIKVRVTTPTQPDLTSGFTIEMGR